MPDPTDSDTRLVECLRCGAGNRIRLANVISAPEGLRCGKCKAALFLDRSAPWHGPQVIEKGKAVAREAAAYQHPLDRDALASVQQIPGVDSLLKKLIEHTFERYDRLFHQASYVKAGDGQLSTLAALFDRAARSLGLDERPDLFLFTDPRPNAHSGGVEKPYIAISSGLVDLMDDDEVRAVMVHELAHWQCRHVLYKQATNLIVQAGWYVASATFGLASLAIAPIRLALLKWDRCSELSADRGMLVGTRDPMLSMRVLFKLAGGSLRLRGELSLDRFIEQAERAQRAEEESVLDKLFTLFQSLYQTHPFPLWRAAELWKWARSDEYLSLIRAP